MHNTVEEISQLYTNFGKSDYIGETVSIIDHSRLAAYNALSNGATQDEILAAFFHDIGHVIGFSLKSEQMSGLGTMHHDSLGAEYLKERGFSEQICNMVGNHVNAKRYLVSIDESYYHSLSEASKSTLDFQGGKMSAEELEIYESDTNKDLYTKFRKLEEEAKLPVEGIEAIPSFEYFMDLAQSHLSAREGVVLN